MLRGEASQAWRIRTQERVTPPSAFAFLRRPVSAVSLMALLWTATRALVVAQADEEPQERPGLSRAALLEAARRAAAEDVVEPERTTAETGLHRFAQFSPFLADVQNFGRGFRFDGGDFPSGAGFAYGLGFRDLAVGSIYADADHPNRVVVNAVAAYSTSEYAQLSGDFSLRNLGGSPITLDVRGRFFEHPKEDFYGFGPGSQESNRTSYLLRSTDVGADLTCTLQEGFAWKAVSRT